MSGSHTGAGPLVPTKSLWTWSAPIVGQAPTPMGFPGPGGSVSLTKSGITADDLQRYIQTPLVFGTPPTPIDPAEILNWIRWAEDDIEASTNIRLCQTWVAAPAAKTNAQLQALNIGAQNNFQQPGIDFDVEEPGYDFWFERWRDEGWGNIHLRTRPVKSLSLFDPTGIISSNAIGMKNASFIYPLLSEFFRMPDTWKVEDQNRGLIRFVPSTSVQMLPLFAMQLAFMGFAESVPQGLWFQYTAGLTPADYAGDWSFMKRLVLAKAAMTAFQTIQTGINNGALEYNTIGDGLSYRVKFSEKGAYFPQIQQQEKVVETLTRRAISACGGFALGYL